jgi:hypothetical protein
MSVIKDEKGVKKATKALLDKHSWFWWMPPANGYGKVGISDFNCLNNGVFIAIETKFGSNKPTIPQRAYLESIQASGGFAFVVTEKNLEQLDIFLTNFDQQTVEVMKNKQMSHEAGAAMLDALRALQALV